MLRNDTVPLEHALQVHMPVQSHHPQRIARELELHRPFAPAGACPTPAERLRQLLVRGLARCAGTRAAHGTGGEQHPGCQNDTERGWRR